MSKADATAEANRLRAEGASVQDINNKLLGYGVWTDKNGKTEIYKAKDQGHGKIRFRKAGDLRNEKNKEENKRQSDLKLSNKHLKKNQLAIAQAIKTANKAKGLQTDHIIERQTSGQAIRQLRREEKLGLITKEELKNQLKIVQGYGIGDDPVNLEGKSGSENRQKAREVKAKNKALEKAEKKNLSKRYGKLTFQQLFIDKNNKKGNSRNSKAVRNPQNRLAIGTDNDWSDPLLFTPVFRTLDKSIDVSL
tara:strand:+ start:1058 stop:1807 length:750 start_codon:yes stop_codon:yes gene_type:complete